MGVGGVTGVGVGVGVTGVGATGVGPTGVGVGTLAQENDGYVDSQWSTSVRSGTYVKLSVQSGEFEVSRYCGAPVVPAFELKVLVASFIFST